MGVGIGINIGEWGAGVWKNADGAKWGGGGGGCQNSSRFRLRVGRE